MTKFTFIAEESDGSTTTKTIKCTYWIDALNAFSIFLKGAGFLVPKGSISVLEDFKTPRTIVTDIVTHPKKEEV